MAERREITETLHHFDSEESMSLAEFIALLQSILDGVPEPLREKVRYVAEGGYYDSPGSQKIELTRPETDAEVAKREADARRYDEIAAQREINQYLVLKAKYERTPQ